MIPKKICLLIAVMVVFYNVTTAEAWMPAEINRLTGARELFLDAEKRPVKDILAEFEATGSPGAYLGIYEAMAKTFRDIDDEYGDNTPEGRARLFAQIKLNMAYFQMGGSKQESPGGSELNRLIQRKLKHYLPDDVWNNPKLFHSLD